MNCPGLIPNPSRLPEADQVRCPGTVIPTPWRNSPNVVGICDTCRRWVRREGNGRMWCLPQAQPIETLTTCMRLSQRPQDAPGSRPAVPALSRWTAVPLPSVLCLGCDPGVHTALALVGPDGIVSVRSWTWSGPEDTRTGEAIAGWLDGCQTHQRIERATTEILGMTRGAARGLATSWAGMSRYGGRADEMIRRVVGVYPTPMDAATWRGALGLPGKATDREWIEIARTVPGCPARLNDHEAAAILIACAGGKSEAGVK